MTIRVAAAMLVLTSIAFLAVVSGCRQSPLLDPMIMRHGPSTVGPGDTVPPPPPPPPPPPTIVPIAFAGAESTYAGGTGQLHWVVGNESPAPFPVAYTLT